MVERVVGVVDSQRQTNAATNVGIAQGNTTRLRATPRPGNDLWSMRAMTVLNTKREEHREGCHREGPQDRREEVVRLEDPAVVVKAGEGARSDESRGCGLGRCRGGCSAADR